MIDGSVFISNFNIWFLLRKLFTIFSSVRVALSKGDAVVTEQGTSPQWILLMVEKAEVTPGVLFHRPFSASKLIRLDVRSCHAGFSL